MVLSYHVMHNVGFNYFIFLFPALITMVLWNIVIAIHVKGLCTHCRVILHKYWTPEVSKVHTEICFCRPNVYKPLDKLDILSQLFQTLPVSFSLSNWLKQSITYDDNNLYANQSHPCLIIVTANDSTPVRMPSIASCNSLPSVAPSNQQDNVT